MTAATESIAGSLVLRVMVPLGAGFFLSNLFRSLNAVISPYLIADLHLSAQALGLLVSMYFFTSAVFQAPLGLLMDRYGPRRVQGTLMVVATVGILMFGLSSNFAVMLAGRAIMGIGAAGALMTAFQAIVLWSAPLRWPSLNGWIMAAGGMGSLVATVPAALVLHLTSWRGLMLITAVASLAVGATIFALTPERTDAPRPGTVREQVAGLLSIYRDRLFWRLAPFSAAMAGCNFAFAGLWAGPWLKDVGGFGPDGIAVSLLFQTALVTVAYVVSGKVAAALMRRGVRLTRVIGAMMLLSMLMQLPLLLPSTAGRWVVMFAMGAFGGATALAYPVLNGHFPVRLSGRVSTALNLFVFVGGVRAAICGGRGHRPVSAGDAGDLSRHRLSGRVRRDDRRGVSELGVAPRPGASAFTICGGGLMRLFDLAGKTAIVTGSSRGIGRAIAELFAEAGARVVISSRKAEACAAVVAAIAAAGGDAVAIPCNIGDKAQLENLVAGTRQHFGAIDILVCCAGINPHYGPLTEIADATFDRIIATNVRSALTLSALVLPEMAARRDGAIIIVASIAGLRGTAGLGAYAISKAAAMQLARNLALEWGPHNIRVNCLAPGLIRTDFARALWEDEALMERRLASTPLRRIGEPDEVAGAALLLASPAGRFITGQTIVIDGGVTSA